MILTKYSNLLKISFSKFALLTFLLTAISCTQSCKQESSKNQDLASHNSKNSLDWSGTYTGIFPCASCEGIETSLTINYEGTYSLQISYLGKDELNTFEREGTFSWNEAGNTITLENEEAPNQYFVGENYLAKLDMNGNRITGDLADRYQLSKKMNLNSDK